MVQMKDKPETDPNVKALSGFDICAMSVAELEAEGVRLEPRANPPQSGRRWLTHSEYDGRNRAHAVVARAYARAQAHHHVKATGELKGLVLRRSFPCLGSFLLVEEFEHGPQVLACDVCGEELAVYWPLDRFGDRADVDTPTAPAF
jgi:hypothetical protein